MIRGGPFFSAAGGHHTWNPAYMVDLSRPVSVSVIFPPDRLAIVPERYVWT